MNGNTTIAVIPQVSQEISYQIFATSATFFVPLILILLLYWRIFITARSALRGLNGNTTRDFKQFFPEKDSEIALL